MPATATQPKRVTPAEVGLPDSVALRADAGAVAFEQVDGGDRAARGTLYSGGVFVYKGVRMVIDLESIQLATPRQMMLEHRSRIGVWDSLATPADATGAISLTGSGVMFDDEPEVQRLARHAGKGYPFEASIRVSNADLDFYDEGDTTQVNGRAVTGPVVVQRNARLREISICDVGVDPDTATAILAATPETGATAMAETETAVADETAAAEETATPSVADLTIEQLMEMRPDLVEAIRESAAPAGETAAEETTEMSHAAATPDELEAIAPESPALVLMALKKGFTTDQFEAVVETVRRSAAAQEAAGESPSDGGGGTHATAGDHTQLSADPDEAWDQSEALQKRFGGNKNAFLMTAMSCERAGDDFRTLAKKR